MFHTHKAEPFKKKRPPRELRGGAGMQRQHAHPWCMLEASRGSQGRRTAEVERRQPRGSAEGPGGREEPQGLLVDGCLTHRRFNSAQIPQLG